jgi:hypothetical protein
MEGDSTPFEITEALLEEEVMCRLLTYSTSLFACHTREDTQPGYCRSGTFVATTGGRHLRTAAHVWERVRSLGPDGWVMQTNVFASTIDRSTVGEDFDYLDLRIGFRSVVITR